MKNSESLIQDILSKKKSSRDHDEVHAYALEGFAREIDYAITTELMTKLILDHSNIAKRIEELNEELEQSEENLLEAQKIAALGRWDFYPDIEKTVWSGSMYDILEIDPKETSSNDLFFSRVHPEDLETVKQTNRQMQESKEPWSIRYRLIMDDGRIKWVQIRFSPKKDEKGMIVHNCGTIQDITEMKKAEEQLEKYNRHLEDMVDVKVREISESQMATIYALVKLSESRDDDTGTHIERTASFCRLLAQKAEGSKYSYQIDDKFINTIYRASPPHDIGKVGIPDSILLKPEKLTVEEFEIMKNHVRIGYDTLAEVGDQYQQNEFIKMGMDIALYHHEKWDGSGYNEGLSSEKIPLAARIMAIADVYDALRSKRVYKEAYSHEKSYEIILSGRGKHFDPVLVDVFSGAKKDFMDLYDFIGG